MSAVNQAATPVAIGLLAVSSTIGVWVGEGDTRRGLLVVVVLGACVCLRIRSWLIVGLILVASIGCARSSHEWRAVDVVSLGPYSGEATLASDPHPIGSALKVTLTLEDGDFDTWVYGSARHRIAALQAGDVVYVDGVRRALSPHVARRSHIGHIVGRFDLGSLRSVAGGALGRSPALVRAANRMRRTLASGAANLADERAALFAGLVYGDDSNQSRQMIQRFRVSGLAHLTAVSGQNVAYVLQVISPLLTRLRRMPRLGSTSVVLTWFAVMTRLEPSVVRAVTMAAITVIALTCGRPLSSWSVLGIAVSLLVIIDPFLVWSVGWWLSVAGSTGLIAVSPPLMSALAGFGLRSWIVNWIGPTCAAQVAVLPILASVFGMPNALSIPCNLLAAPVAGMVMLVGMPTAVISSFLPRSIASATMAPLGVGVAWVDRVARAGARWDLPWPLDVTTSFALVVGVTVCALIGSRNQVPGGES